MPSLSRLPVTAFAGLTRPSTASVQHTRPSSSSSIAASVQAERRASIQRTLHSNDHTGSTSAASSPRKRKSGPPRPYSDQPAAPLSDFASSSTILSTSTTVTNGAELEAVQNALNRANLVFTVDVANAGPIFEAIDVAFEEHCRTSNIDFAPFRPASTQKTPNTTAWVLLGRLVGLGLKIHRFTFTLQAISASPFTHTSNHLSEGPCIFIECASSTLLLTHCSSQETVCLNTSLCISASLDESFIHCLPPSVVIRRQHALLLAHRLLLVHSGKRLPLGYSAPLDLTLQHMPGSGAFSLTSWQHHITPPFAMNDNIHIRAAILWLFGGRPTGLKFKEIVEEQFRPQRPKIDGPVTDQSAFLGLQIAISAVGKGSRNETIALAVRMLLSDGHYWVEHEGHLTLRLHPCRAAIPSRACTLRATGFILFLHFVFIGAPIPVSPFLFSTIFDGRPTATKFDLEFLTRFMTLPSLETVKSFHRVPLTDRLYSSPTDKRFQILLNLPEMDPTMIGLQRCQAEQDGIIAAIISYLTLGTVDITNQPDFRILEDGFNMCVEAFGGQDRPHHVLEWFATPCKQLILSAFDRQIKSAADLVSHLEYAHSNRENDPWGDNTETVAIFKRFVSHYLSEPGHPEDHMFFEALLDDELRENRDDPLLRPKLFLSVLTGSTSLSIDPDWVIKCDITHDWNEEFPHTGPDGVEDYGPDADVSIFFRACFQSYTISNNAMLRFLLLSRSWQRHDVWPFFPRSAFEQ
ncbi:hypothetical protein R3P38DRAFT_3407634 [Favolaschia claudopus]|uniref:Uncharacterized protein n=1 Tax=Favolaschia claudopus TaxID=2862362 RepID=A0AAV9ZWM4_9AGAR